MKIIFISDIHGISNNLDKIKEKFKYFKCDKLVILGDVFNNYNYYVSDKNYLNSFLEYFKDKLICVRGNCDSIKDLWDIPVKPIKELDIIKTINNDIYITHGHIYNESNWDKDNTILVYGHLHRPFIKKIDTNYYINPGSISIPRGDNDPTYMIYDEEKFTIYDIYDNKICEEKI